MKWSENAEKGFEGEIMALWAIGDFHLSFSADKPMEIFDTVWKNHEKKIAKHFRKLVKTTDT